MSLASTVDALMPEWPVLEAAVRAEVSSRCATFVRTQLTLAPLHIRTGFRVLFAAYSVYLMFVAGISPGRAAVSDALTAFSALPLPLVGGLERLLRSATLLAFCEDPAVRSALGEETSSDRQRIFRALRNGAAQ